MKVNLDKSIGVRYFSQDGEHTILVPLSFTFLTRSSVVIEGGEVLTFKDASGTSISGGQVLKLASTVEENHQLTELETPFVVSQKQNTIYLKLVCSRPLTEKETYRVEVNLNLDSFDEKIDLPIAFDFTAGQGALATAVNNIKLGSKVVAGISAFFILALLIVTLSWWHRQTDRVVHLVHRDWVPYAIGLILGFLGIQIKVIKLAIQNLKSVSNFLKFPKFYIPPVLFNVLNRWATFFVLLVIFTLSLFFGKEYVPYNIKALNDECNCSYYLVDDEEKIKEVIYEKEDFKLLATELEYLRVAYNDQKLKTKPFYIAETFKHPQWLDILKHFIISNNAIQPSFLTRNVVDENGPLGVFTFKSFARDKEEFSGDTSIFNAMVQNRPGKFRPNPNDSEEIIFTRSRVDYVEANDLNQVIGSVIKADTHHLLNEAFTTDDPYLKQLEQQIPSDQYIPVSIAINTSQTSKEQLFANRLGDGKIARGKLRRYLTITYFSMSRMHESESAEVMVDSLLTTMEEYMPKEDIKKSYITKPKYRAYIRFLIRLQTLPLNNRNHDEIERRFHDLIDLTATEFYFMYLEELSRLSHEINDTKRDFFMSVGLRGSLNNKKEGIQKLRFASSSDQSLKDLSDLLLNTINSNNSNTAD